MSSVVFFSAKGAPGATTAAMLAASLWHRPALLADCDPAGGDMGLRLPTPGGRPLDLRRGMLSLLPVARRSLHPNVLLEHAQQVLGGGEVLVGMSGPEQAAAVGPLWATLAKAFGGLTSHDAFIDVGRLESRSPVMPVVAAAQLAACVVQASLSGVFATRTRLRTLLPIIAANEGGGPRVGVIVQSADRRDAAGAAAVIQEEFPALVYLGHLATDPIGARIFDGQPVSRPERTMLVRSGAEMVAALYGALAAMQPSMDPAMDPQYDAPRPVAAPYAIPAPNTASAPYGAPAPQAPYAAPPPQAPYAAPPPQAPYAAPPPQAPYGAPPEGSPVMPRTTRVEERRQIKAQRAARGRRDPNESGPM